MKKVKLFEEYNLSEKKITLTWNDDDNSIVFSDGEIATVDYDGEFIYRGELFTTIDHEDSDGIIKDLEKRFKRDRFEWIGESFIKEGKMRVFLDKIIGAMVEKGLGVAYPHKMRQEIKEKIRSVIKETMEKYDYELLESKESDALAKEIDKAITKIDDSMGYEDFADAVASVLKDGYGSHNYDLFIKELKKKL